MQDHLGCPLDCLARPIILGNRAIHEDDHALFEMALTGVRLAIHRDDGAVRAELVSRYEDAAESCDGSRCHRRHRGRIACPPDSSASLRTWAAGGERPEDETQEKASVD